MPKNLPAQIITQIDAQQKRPVYLFELGLSSTIRFAAFKTNIIFPTGGNTYIAKTIKTPNISQGIEGQIDRVTVQFCNVSRDMAAYANVEDFRGKSLIIKRIYLDEISNASYYNEIFNGYMERPSEISSSFLTVPATLGKPLNRKCLKFAYQRMCPWQFGGSECNTNGNADLKMLTASGTIQSGTTSTFIDSTLTQAQNYWNYGRVEITKSGIVYHRIAQDFNWVTQEVTLDVGLAFAIDNTCTYVIYKGCDQTWPTCRAFNPWGASDDNYLNFGGCIHIAKKLNEA